MSDLPPIEALRCFVVAARHKSFRKAATDIHLSAAAFGQRIKQLEDYVGAPLFERGPRVSLRLTASGTELLSKAQDILNEIGAWPTQLFGQHPPRELVIGTRHELGISWILPLLKELEATTLGLTLRLHFGSGDEILRALESKTCDLAISSARVANSRFAAHHLHEEKYVLVCAPHTKRPRTLEQLMKQTLIDIDPSLPLFRYFTEAESSRGYLQIENVRSLGTIAAIRTFVLQEGIAVLPRYFVKEDIKAKRLKVLFPKKAMLSDHFRLLHLPKHRDAEVLKDLASLLKQKPLS